MNIEVRKHLCAEDLINSVYHEFQKIPDPIKLSRQSISFTDILMSGLAIFSLKFPSLLKYDQERNHIKENLQTLYHVNNPPSDTYLRERLDELNPVFIRPAFKKIFANLQRGNCLKEFTFLVEYYLVATDGTGYFSSSDVRCEHCCTKNHKDGSVTYYHQMFGGCIVHPEKSNVIPLCPEVIKNEDGNEKNDCELNAAKRFIANLKREHPHLKVIILADGITSNAPYIQLLENNDLKFILGAKPGDHEFLFKNDRMAHNKGPSEQIKRAVDKCCKNVVVGKVGNGTFDEAKSHFSKITEEIESIIKDNKTTIEDLQAVKTYLEAYEIDLSESVKHELLDPTTEFIDAMKKKIAAGIVAKSSQPSVPNNKLEEFKRSVNDFFQKTSPVAAPREDFSNLITQLTSCGDISVLESLKGYIEREEYKSKNTENLEKESDSIKQQKSRDKEMLIEVIKERIKLLKQQVVE